jgi:hypothetical protein
VVWPTGAAIRSKSTMIIYYLSHALVIAIGVALTLLHSTVWTAVGTSLIAAGAAGAVIYLYIARTDRTRDAIEMLTFFGMAQVYDRRGGKIRPEFASRLEKVRSQIDIINFGLDEFRRDYMNELARFASRAQVCILLVDPTSVICGLRDMETDQCPGTNSLQDNPLGCHTRKPRSHDVAARIGSSARRYHEPFVPQATPAWPCR